MAAADGRRRNMRGVLESLLAAPVLDRQVDMPSYKSGEGSQLW